MILYWRYFWHLEKSKSQLITEPFLTFYSPFKTQCKSFIWGTVFPWPPFQPSCGSIFGHSPLGDDSAPHTHSCYTFQLHVVSSYLSARCFIYKIHEFLEVENYIFFNFVTPEQCAVCCISQVPSRKQIAPSNWVPGDNLTNGLLQRHSQGLVRATWNAGASQG